MRYYTPETRGIHLIRGAYGIKHVILIGPKNLNARQKLRNRLELEEIKQKIFSFSSNPKNTELITRLFQVNIKKEVAITCLRIGHAVICHTLHKAGKHPTGKYRNCLK